MTIFQKTFLSGGLCDNGAEADLIELSYLAKILNLSKSTLLEKLSPPLYKIEDFSSNNIRIVGYTIAQIMSTIDSNIYNIPLNVFVSKQKVNCPIVIGQPTLAITKTILDYSKSPPEASNFKSKFCSQMDLRKLEGHINKLQPYKATKISFALQQPIFANINEKILIDSNILYINEKDHIEILPVTSPISFHSDIGYYVEGLLINQSNTEFTGHFSTYFEYLDQYVIKKLTKHNISNISLCADVFPYSKYFDPILSVSVNSQQLKKNATSSYCIYNVSIDTPTNSCVPLPFPINSKFPENQTLHEFTNPKDCIDLGAKYGTINEDEDIFEAKGYELPPITNISVNDIVNLQNFPEVHQPYINNIFLESYPDVISLNALDLGDISKTIGSYTIRVKSGQRIPKYKKTYFSASNEYFKSLLDFMEKKGIIVRAPSTGDSLDTYVCAGFVVKRSDPSKPGRLVVDFSHLNQILSSSFQSIPNMKHQISKLRNRVLYSKTDISGAFNSMSISTDSQRLSAFSTPYGQYRFKKLPTGLRSSPEIFNRAVHRIIHYTFKKDEDGNIVYGEDDLPIFEPSPLDDVFLYFDDILIATKIKQTFPETLEHHFEAVKMVMMRLHNNYAKISFDKSEFAKSKIGYLGFLISNNFVTPDPRRIEDLIKVPLPETPKGWRSFNGLVGTIRECLYEIVMKDYHPFNSLTSKFSTGKPSKEQIECFHSFKRKLTTYPIYNCVIDENADKILFTDASSALTGTSYAAILGQVISYKENQLYVPNYLFLDDKIHQQIFDLDIKCRPAPLQNNNESKSDYIKRVQKGHPPDTSYLLNDFKGFDETTFKNSLFLSLNMVLALNNCLHTSDFYNQDLIKEIKSSVVATELLVFEYKNDRRKLNMLYQNIAQNFWPIDKNMSILKALSKILKRTIIVITSDDKNQTIIFNDGLQRPPFYFLQYFYNTSIILRPAFIDRSYIFDLSKYRNRFEIVHYLSRPPPKSHLSKAIIDLELNAIMSALDSFKHYLHNCNLTLVTDSKALFFLFNDQASQTQQKFVRYRAKILQDFPNIKFAFCKSEQNLADFMSKSFKLDKSEAVKIQLPKFDLNLIDHLIPLDTSLTASEWSNLVNNDKFLLSLKTPKNLQVQLLTVFINNVNKQRPITISYQNDNGNEIVDKIFQKKRKGRPKRILQKEFPDSHDSSLTMSDLVPELGNISENPISEKLEQESIISELPPKSGSGSDMEDISDKIPENPLDFQKSQTVEELVNLEPKSFINPVYEKALLDTLRPIRILRERTSKEEILLAQKLEYSEIYEKAFLNQNTFIEFNNKKYIMKDDILLIVIDNHRKILLPSKILTLKISLEHLISNHKGYETLSKLLSNYYHPDMLKLIRSLTSFCLSCQLENKGTKRQILGFYPTPKRSFEVVHMDLAESLNNNLGYEHILVMVCALTGALFCFPLKSKGAQSFLITFLFSIYQFFKPSKILSDNATIFINLVNLKVLHALNCDIIYTTANSPLSKGLAESHVKIIKKALTKYVIPLNSKDWIYILPLITLNYNQTLTRKTGFAPFDLLYTNFNNTNNIWEKEITENLHPKVIKSIDEIKALQNHYKSKISDVQNMINKEKRERNEILNKSRVNKKFNTDSLVLVLKRSTKKGTNKALDAKFQFSPFVIEKEKSQSVELRRLTDAQLYNVSKNDVKTVPPHDPAFNNLPPIVKKILVRDYKSLSLNELEELTRLDPFEIPLQYDQDAIPILDENIKEVTFNDVIDK